MAGKAAPRRGRKKRGARGADAKAPPAVRAARHAIGQLEALGKRYALIGGQAVAARTEPRFTEDVDLAVEVASDDEAQALTFAFAQAGWVVRAAVEQKATGRLATVRLNPPSENSDVFVDLLYASSGIEGETVKGATPLTVLTAAAIPVARVGHLIALKVLSEGPHRLQDRIDLEKLFRAASPADLVIARRSLALIERRGFARGKNLERVFERYRRRVWTQAEFDELERAVRGQRTIDRKLWR